MVVCECSYIPMGTRCLSRALFCASVREQGSEHCEHGGACVIGIVFTFTRDKKTNKEKKGVSKIYGKTIQTA